MSPNDAPTVYLKRAYQNMIDTVQKTTDTANINKALGKAMDAKIKYNAQRISRTEIARASNEAFHARYDDDERVTGFQWVLSSRHNVTDECTMMAELDNGAGPGVYRKDDFPQLPVHPNCMCMKVPYFGEPPGKTQFTTVRDYLLGKPDKERYAIIGKRDGQHQTLYRRGLEARGIHLHENPKKIPEEFLAKKMPEGVIGPREEEPVVEVAAAPERIRVNPESEVYQKLGERHYNEMHDLVNNAPELERKVWEKLEGELKVKDAASRRGPHYDPAYGGVALDIDAAARGESEFRNPHQTTFHEFGHNIDFLTNVKQGSGLRRVGFSAFYEDGKFEKAIREEVDGLVDRVAREMRDEFRAGRIDYEWLRNKRFILNAEYDYYQTHGVLPNGVPRFRKSMAYEKISDEIRAIPEPHRAAVSDILGGATGNKIRGGFGHFSPGYWRNHGSLAQEAFAGMFESAMASPEGLEKIKLYLPKSHKVYLEMLDSILKGR